MKIWHGLVTLEEINARCKDTLSDYLEIAFVEIGTDYLKAVMPIRDYHKQPVGIVHGGMNVVLAETVASTAANMCVDRERFYCVGLEINANHLRPGVSQDLTTIARPIHLGKTTQVWNIEILNSSGKLTCFSRMTAAVIEK